MKINEAILSFKNKTIVYGISKKSEKFDGRYTIPRIVKGKIIGLYEKLDLETVCTIEQIITKHTIVIPIEEIFKTKRGAFLKTMDYVKDELNKNLQMINQSDV